MKLESDGTQTNIKHFTPGSYCTLAGIFINNLEQNYTGTSDKIVL